MYHILYDVEAIEKGISKEEAAASGKGSCTALLIGSILYPPDGSYSVLFSSIDGRTNQPLPPEEEWKAWIMMAKYLSDRPDLPPGKRDLAAAAWETFRDAVLAIKDKPENQP